LLSLGTGKINAKGDMSYILGLQFRLSFGQKCFSKQKAHEKESEIQQTKAKKSETYVNITRELHMPKASRIPENR
jgi:hypothetical protein